MWIYICGYSEPLLAVSSAVYKPNTKQANQTNEKVTGKGVQKVHMSQKGSNQLEETESVEMTRLQGKQALLTKMRVRARHS